MIIYGRNSVSEILLHHPEQIEEIFFLKSASSNKLREIIETAAKKKVRVSYLDKTELERLSQNTNHQGVAARIKDFKYTEFRSLIKDNTNRFYLILDHIEDPHNLGAIIRTANFFGVNAVILPKDRAAGVTPAVIKTSSGATATIPLCSVSNIGNAIAELKKRDVWIIGADPKADQTVQSTDIGGLKIALVIGSEGSGIKRNIREKCDFLVSIPGSGKVRSLNASVAAGILINEIKARAGL